MVDVDDVLVALVGPSTTTTKFSSDTLLKPFVSFSSFYRPQTKLRKGNLFTPVCDSVHGRRGISLNPGAVYNPTRQTPQGRHLLPPSADTPQTATPDDGHCSKRYTSHWNAILLPTVREGNVFTCVSDSVHNRPQGYSVTPCCGGRYASYWNVFLF